MSEFNEKPVNSNELSDLQKMFSDYQKNQQSQKTRKTKEEILAKYFVPRNTKEIIRILKPKAGEKHIKEAFFHVVSTNASGGKKKHGTIVYCPAHNDPKVAKLDSDGNPILDQNGNKIMVPAPCPLCDRAKKILAKQDQSIRGIKKDQITEAQAPIFEKNKLIFSEANKWEAKKFYIIKVIDRGAEKHGVKFFRFKHNFKNQGTLDKLLPVLQEYVDVNKKDFADVNEGTDITIIMAESDFNGKPYKAISAITTRGKSPLHNDPIIAQEWLNDEMTWRDVFKPKKGPNITPYEYLQLIVAGNDPYYDETDQNNKHWVFPNNPELQEKANNRTRNTETEEDDSFEYASDLDDDSTISNVTNSNIGSFNDNAVDVTKSVTADNDIDDLPF